MFVHVQKAANPISVAEVKMSVSRDVGVEMSKFNIQKL